jgi:hypothetical protein
MNESLHSVATANKMNDDIDRKKEAMTRLREALTCNPWAAHLPTLLLSIMIDLDEISDHLTVDESTEKPSK